MLPPENSESKNSVNHFEYFTPFKDYETMFLSSEDTVSVTVLPSFEVNIAMTHSYILLNSEQFEFTISAK